MGLSMLDNPKTFSDLYSMSLCYGQWEGVSTFHFFTGADDYFFICDGLFYSCIFFDYGILHQNTVSDNRSLGYFHTTE